MKLFHLDDDMIASQTSVDVDKYSFVSSIKKQKTDYETKLKEFLLDVNCQCDFDRLEAYFLQEQKDKSNQNLFSLHHAIVLGKLGRHIEALEKFLKNGYYIDAESYCEIIYLNGDTILARQLYRQLIEHYLKQSNDGNLNENSLKSILRIVNNVAERLDPVLILEILPGQLKLNGMTDFIEHSLQTCSTTKHGSQVERNLLYLKLLRTQSNRIVSESRAFTIDGDTKCARQMCTARFTATQAVVRFPDNQIVHLHCRAKYEAEREKSNKRRY